MRRHVKASSAGSPRRQAVVLGRFIASLLALAALLAFATSAYAGQTRVLSGSFGTGGTGASTFGDPSQLAFDQASDKLYVLDKAGSAIHAFNAPGLGLPGSPFPLSVASPGGEPDLAADSSNHNIYYVSENSGLYGFDSSTGSGLAGLNPKGGFGDPCGVAVDPAGNIWVGDYSTKSVKEFDTSGNSLGSVSTSAQGRPCHVAFDSTGDMFVALYSGAVWKYTAPAYTTATLFDSSTTYAIAVDRAAHVLYVAHSNAVFAYNATTGSHLYDFANKVAGADYHGLAVDEGADTVYVSDTGSGNNQVHVFGPPVFLPDATTGTASALTGARATVSGTVNPNNEPVTNCHFVYGTTTAYGSEAPCIGSIPTDSSSHPVTAKLTNLTPNGVTYHFKIVATNANGSTSGNDQTFKTPDAVLTGAASGISGTKATLNGTVNPDTVTVTNCHFEYTTDDEFQTKGFSGAAQAACPPPGSGSSPVPVSAPVSNLNPGTTYRFRLIAEYNGQPAVGGNAVFLTLGPQIKSSSVSFTSITDTTATLKGTINPGGEGTGYYFEYVTLAQFEESGYLGAGKAPAGVAGVGNGTVDVEVSTQITGLLPATAYRARLVAANPSATAFGSTLVFATYPTPIAGLPDGRAYEQASPVDKVGGSIQRGYSVARASPAGDRISFGDVIGLPTSGGSQILSLYVASRTPSAWTLNGGVVPDVAPPSIFTEVSGVSEDLSASLSMVTSGAAHGLYIGDTLAGTWQHIPITLWKALVADYAEDAGHFIFDCVFCEELAPAGGAATVVYDFDHGAFTLAGRVPEFPATHCDDASGPACVPAPYGSFSGPYQWAEFVGAPGELPNAKYYLENTISNDGSKVFFTERYTGRLFMREDGTATTQISASQRTTPDPHGDKRPAAWVGSTPSGSKVFFLSCEKLTDDSTAFTEEPLEEEEEEYCFPWQGQDLYSYDTSSDELTDLTVDTNGDPKGAAVQGFLGASADGSNAYFVANGVLAPGAEPGTCNKIAAEGACSLYLSHDGVVSFVTRLNATSIGGNGALGSDNWVPRDDHQNNFAKPKSSRVAADGTLVFTSTRSLTGYDNTCVDETCICVQKKCGELFRYRPGDSAPICISCNPTGAPPLDTPVFTSDGTALASNINRLSFLTRNISPDGNRVFFDSPDKLVPGDVNGDVSCETSEKRRACLDVYEWEAEGTGSCHSSDANGGCLYLISSGTNPTGAAFGDASVSGDDVFLFTDQPFVNQDKDDQVDAYDARVGGGLASQNQVPPPPCSGEACRGPGSTPPDQQGAGTGVFEGPGNPEPVSSCPKGKVRRHGKCVRRHRRHPHKRGSQRRANSNRGGQK